jgi:hypothetical protein
VVGVFDVLDRRVSVVTSELALGASTSALGGARAETSRAATNTVTISVRVHYVQSAATWRGTFISTSSGGHVVDRASALDRPRHSTTSDWRIQRKLESKKGTLLFDTHGPFHQPTATLTWALVDGTGQYSGLVGTGEDVEHISTTTAAAHMLGVPTN